MTTPTLAAVMRALRQNPSRVRLMGVIAEDRIYSEAGKPWDALGIEGQLAQRLRPLLAAGLAVLSEREESARRPLYALTEPGQRLLALYSALTRKAQR